MASRVRASKTSAGMSLKAHDNVLAGERVHVRSLKVLGSLRRPGVRPRACAPKPESNSCEIAKADGPVLVRVRVSTVTLDPRAGALGDNIAGDTEASEE